jgi:hypothetical protein
LGASPRTRATNAIGGGGAIPGLSGDWSVTAVVSSRRGRSPPGRAMIRENPHFARANAKIA